MTLTKLSDSLLEFVTSFGSFMPGLLASVLCEVELHARVYIYPEHTVMGYSYVYTHCYSKCMYAHRSTRSLVL